MKCEYVDYFHAAILQNYAICLALEVNCLSLPCLYKTQLKSDTFTNLNSNFLSREERWGGGMGWGKEDGGGRCKRHEIYAYRVCRARSVEYRNKLTTHHFGLGQHDGVSGSECALGRRHEYYKLVCVGVKDVRTCKGAQVNLVLVATVEAPPTNQCVVSFVHRAILRLILVLQRSIYLVFFFNK